MSNEYSTFRYFFNQIDLYGLTFPLKYKKHNSYNTLCGIALSLITIFGMSAVILFFIIKSFNRSDFSIITNTEHLYRKHLFNFTNNPFLVGYVNNEGRAVEIDPTYLTITLDKNDHYPERNEKGIVDVRRESMPIALEKCKIGVHFNESDIIEMIKDFEYENYLCPVPGQNLSIGGRWGDNVHGYDMLEFHVIKCENTTEKQICHSFDELEQFFKNSYFHIIYLAQSLDHYDVKNPIKKKFRSEIFLIVTQLVKRYYYYFLPGEYISDDGVIFSNHKYYDYFEYERTVIDFVDKEDQDYYSAATIAEVAFSSIDKFTTVKRKYSKIQDSLGNIGGWIRIILVVCQSISNFFSEKIFLVDIINTISMPHYKSNQKIKLKEEKESSKINNYINNDNSNNRSINPILMKNPKENKSDSFDLVKMNTENRISKIENKHVNLSFYEYFLPLWAMEYNHKYSFFLDYRDFIYKDISLEVLVPLIERLLKHNMLKAKEESKKYLSKMSSTLFQYNNMSNGRYNKHFKK